MAMLPAIMNDGEEPVQSPKQPPKIIAQNPKTAARPFAFPARGRDITAHPTNIEAIVAHIQRGLPQIKASITTIDQIEQLRTRLDPIRTPNSPKPTSLRSSPR